MTATILQTRRAMPILVLLALVLMAAAACGGDDGGAANTPTASGIDYRSLRGEVRVDGSSTVFPISEAVAEEFSKIAPNVRANVAFSGTGGGFEKFCRGEIQVADASRPMNDKEKEACAANGITDAVEFQVAIDALTVVVNPQNTWAKCMTLAQLQLAFKADGAKKWKDLDPSWPDENIVFFTPGADSGTFDYFKEAIKLRGQERDEPAHRSDVTASEDDNVLVRGVGGNRNALGYFGFAFFEEAGDKLKAVDVNGGSGCIAPTFENALTGAYKPLSRPLYIYARETAMKERPELLGFIAFYLENAQALAEEVGYVSLPDDRLAEQQAKIAPLLPR